MKLLYVAGRWDPTIQNEYSGSDYGALRMLKKQSDIEVALVGPLKDQRSRRFWFTNRYKHLRWFGYISAA